MKRFYVVASVPLLLAALIPIAASLYLAQRKAQDDQIAYLTSLADEVLRRGIASRQQLVAALDELDKDASPPCSQASLARMQQMVGTSFYLQGMGSVVDGQLVCSTLTLGSGPVPLPGKPMVTSTGISSWIGARLPFAPEQPFNIYARNGHAVIIHPGIVIDMPVLHADVSLGLAIIAPKALIRSRGPLQEAWLDLYQAPTHSLVESDTHHIVFRSSKENNIAALAAAPKALAYEGLAAQALVLAPLGLFASATLALGVAALTRWTLSSRSRLRAGLRRREFFVLYQPIVDLQTGQWLGAEALLRWRLGSGKDKGTLVPPDEFIAEAERTGVVAHITRYVMDRVLEDLPDLLKASPGFHVSLNLSTQDLVADGPVQYLQQRFEAIGMPPGSLMLEVTERGLVDIEAARPALQAGRQIGASIAMDDFGTGYSSLSMLESIDIDTLKIDRIFIASIGAQAAISPVTTHIIEMAQKLELDLIAEGVETQFQADFLRERGVRHAQGWLFAKAMPLAELLAGLKAQAGR
ncbi:EAL domain-containing protein [Acidovorax sp.]|uniref:EAL domain-containing protein n=1 Tax=Acidovorax sp. TaxID=1872122 RepID=UPI003D06E882